MAEKADTGKSFWTTLPGILTALAGIMTGAAGLLGVVVHENTTVDRAHPAADTSTSVVPTTSTPGPTTTSAGTTGSTRATTPPRPHTDAGIPGVTTTVPSSPGSTTTTAAAPRPRVEAELRADPFSGGASCPVTVQFSGRISLLSGSGTVSYRFARSDGASAPVQTVTFTGPGSKDVSTTWRLGAPGARIVGWQQLVILEPLETRSTQANFDLTCA